MQDVFREKLAVYGRWTYRSAWGLEITAALLGLATGVALTVQSFNGSESAETQDLILAGAPFFMVALAELTKIPIATLMFSAKWVWKPILAIFLLMLAGITFETVFMGLERSTTLRELKYKELEKSLTGLQRERVRLTNEVAALQGRSALNDAQDNLDKLSKLAEQEHQSIQAKLTQAEKELEGGVVLSPEAAQVRDSLSRLEDQRKALVAEKTQAEETARKQFEGQRDSYVARMGADATPELKAKWAQELSALKNPVPDIDANYRKQLEAIAADTAQKQAQFDTLRAAMNTGNTAQQQQAEKRRQELQQQLRDTDAKWATQIDRARDSIGNAQALETERLKKIQDESNAANEIDKQIEAKEDERVTVARKDQVRRLAGWVYGQDAEDVKIEAANRIGLIWFSSLAALAALAGPVCAIVALGLQKIGLTPVDPQRKSQFSKLLRSWTTGRRWKRVRTVTVEKQIPVEQLVKEFVYVPILTDDPEAVKRSLDASLPAEVAEKVKVSVKERKRGNKAQHAGA